MASPPPRTRGAQLGDLRSQVRPPHPEALCSLAAPHPGAEGRCGPGWTAWDWWYPHAGFVAFRVPGLMGSPEAGGFSSQGGEGGGR